MSRLESLDFATCAAATGALGLTTVLALAADVQQRLWVPAGVQLLGAFIALRLWQARTPPATRSLRLLVALQLFSCALAASGLHLGKQDASVAVPALAGGVPLLASFALRDSLAAAAVACAVHTLSFVAAMMLGVSGRAATMGAAGLPVILTALLSLVAVFLLAMGRAGPSPTLRRCVCVVLSVAALVAQVPVVGVPASSLLDCCPPLLLCAAAIARSISQQPTRDKKTD